MGSPSVTLWIAMALDSGIAPMIKVAQIYRYTQTGILNTNVLGVRFI
jgi:hypothetical protein